MSGAFVGPVQPSRCRACGETVSMWKKWRCVMRHQDPYVHGFSISTPYDECPRCGERQNY